MIPLNSKTMVLGGAAVIALLTALGWVPLKLGLILGFAGVVGGTFFLNDNNTNET